MQSRLIWRLPATRRVRPTRPPASNLNVGQRSANFNTNTNSHPRDPLESESESEPASKLPPAPESESESEPTPTGADGEQLASEQSKEHSPILSVDWINRVLFVFDKKRLYCIDFEGKRELLLIDDFNDSNKLMSMHLDPKNNFLFWLQAGRFHASIYRLDLGVLESRVANQRLENNLAKLRAAKLKGVVNANTDFTTNNNTHEKLPRLELEALISRHYAHPIVTDLPKSSNLFLIDHKKSLIYLPINNNLQTTQILTQWEGADQTQGPTSAPAAQQSTGELVTSSQAPTTNNNHTQSSPADGAQNDDTNATTSAPDQEQTSKWLPPPSPSSRSDGDQILSFELDSSDRGPLRAGPEREHLAGLLTLDIQDMALDSSANLLYWLTNEGREIFEEYRDEGKLRSAQHNLMDSINNDTASRYRKLLYFSPYANQTNQPAAAGQGKSAWPSPIGKIMRLMGEVLELPSSSSGYGDELSMNQLLRASGPDDEGQSLAFVRLGASAPETSGHRFSGSTLSLLLLATCLLLAIVYFLYGLLLEKRAHWQRASNPHLQRTDSAASSGTQCSSSGPISEHHPARQGSRHAPRANESLRVARSISRWMQAKQPGSTGAGSASEANYAPDFSTLAPTTNTNSRLASGSYLAPSTPRQTRNAIDEHYNQHAQLASLSSWGQLSLNHELPNKLYVPIEILEDETLASIRRIPLGKLNLDLGSPPLGQGNFGTVHQGTIITPSAGERIKSLARYKAAASLSNSNPLASPILVPDYVNQSRLESLLLDNVHQDLGHLMPVPASTSSGQGSSTHSDPNMHFSTAQQTISNNNSTLGDYLTPNSNSLDSYNNDDYDYDKSVPNPGYHLLGDNEDEHDSGCELKVAIKRLKDGANAQEKRDFLEEAKLLASVNHPNIVQLIGICLDGGNTLIIMELMLGGDLIRYMRENTRHNRDAIDNNNDTMLDDYEQPHSATSSFLTEDDQLAICLDIVNGCCYLEELNFIHRDIAARNCLVSSQLKESRVVKLGDFGLARDIEYNDYYKQLNISELPIKWMAPECLSDSKFSTKSDVWSFGIVMWEIFTYCREKPYPKIQLSLGDKACQIMKDSLANGERLEKPEFCDDDVYTLMSQCWNLNPRLRPNFHHCRAILIEIRNKLKQKQESKQQQEQELKLKQQEQEDREHYQSVQL